MANPILVQAVRGQMVESFYRGSYAVINAEDQIIASAGDIDRLIYARSALKPIQALALIESGAARNYHLTAEEIALACASHNGEDRHVQLIKQWCDKVEIPLSALECGLHSPMSREAATNLARQGLKPTLAHNACSGKHASFLTLAKYLNYSLENYVHKDHPTQQYINKIIAEVCQINLDETPFGIDGCHVPVLGIPLKALASAMAKLARPRKLRASLKKAAENIVAAMQTHPFLLAGTGRFCTDINEITNGKVIVKMGAEGVFTGLVPSEGWGIALKIDDGHAKAAEIAMITLLEHLKVISITGKLTAYAQPLIKNWSKEKVGYFESILSKA
jgi:L-asparaginase II